MFPVVRMPGLVPGATTPPDEIFTEPTVPDPPSVLPDGTLNADELLSVPVTISVAPAVMFTLPVTVGLLTIVVPAWAFRLPTVRLDAAVASTVPELLLLKKPIEYAPLPLMLTGPLPMKLTAFEDELKMPPLTRLPLTFRLSTGEIVLPELFSTAP